MKTIQDFKQLYFEAVLNKEIEVAETTRLALVRVETENNKRKDKLLDEAWDAIFKAVNTGNTYVAFVGIEYQKDYTDNWPDGMRFVGGARLAVEALKTIGFDMDILPSTNNNYQIRIHW